MSDPIGGVFITLINMMGNFLKLFFSRKSTYIKRLDYAQKYQSQLERQLNSETITKNERRAILRKLKTVKFFIIEGIADVPPEVTELFYTIRLTNKIDRNIKDSIKKDIQIDLQGFVKKSSYYNCHIGMILSLIFILLFFAMEQYGRQYHLIFFALAGLLGMLFFALNFGRFLAIRSNLKAYEKAIIRYRDNYKNLFIFFLIGIGLKRNEFDYKFFLVFLLLVNMKSKRVNFLRKSKSF